MEQNRELLTRKVVKSAIDRVSKPRFTPLAELEPNQANYAVLAEQYLNIINKPHPDTRQVFTKEKRFFQDLEPLVKEIGPLTPAEKAVFNSEIIALYDLVVGGSLDILYGQHVDKLKISQKPIPKTGDEEIETKADIALIFLEELKRKNKETEMASASKSPISVGFEIEYTPVLTKLMDYISMRKDTDTVNKINRKWKGLVRYLEERNISINQAAWASHVISYVTSSFSGANLVEEEWLPIAPHKELKTFPSASLKTQVRELLHILYGGGLEGQWIVHQTLGGINLTPDQTEAMDILPISKAAGFLPEREGVNSTDRLSIVERYGKVTSYEDGSIYYFPFHRLRSASGGRFMPFTATQLTAVERRSLPAFKPGTFPLFVRDSTFAYLCAFGIKAYQTPDSLKTKQDADFSKEWTNLISGWKKLLDEQRIIYPANTDRFVKMNASGSSDLEIEAINESEQLDMLRGTTEYERFLKKVEVLSTKNPDFRNRSRTLARNYMRNIRKEINY